MSYKKSDLIVVGDKARPKFEKAEHYVDSVLLEDIYTSLAQEQPGDGQLQICQLSPYCVNPIERECMFRMPGKIQREPMSQFQKFKIQSQCLCKKYGYDRAKQVMLRTIDQAFSRLEQRFAYKMQKSLAKQIDIDLFGDDVRRQKKL